MARSGPVPLVFERPSLSRRGVPQPCRVASAIGLAVTGTILATLFSGDIARSHWSADQTAQFHQAVTIAGLTLTVVSAALVGWGILRSRGSTSSQAPALAGDAVPA